MVIMMLLDGNPTSYSAILAQALVDRELETRSVTVLGDLTGGEVNDLITVMQNARYHENLDVTTHTAAGKIAELLNPGKGVLSYTLSLDGLKAKALRKIIVETLLHPHEATHTKSIHDMLHYLNEELNRQDTVDGGEDHTDADD